jgi:hypothetical protein
VTEAEFLRQTVQHLIRSLRSASAEMRAGFAAINASFDAQEAKWPRGDAEENRDNQPDLL